MTLACPRCKAPLDGRLECSNCGAAYQAVDGEPILLSEELTDYDLSVEGVLAARRFAESERVTRTSELSAWKVSA
jgi:uncharacterized protein YbaR (Trm112 family)